MKENDSGVILITFQRIVIKNRETNHINLEVTMEKYIYNKTSSIRRLKIGTCLFLLAFSFVGTHLVLAEEVNLNAKLVTEEKISSTVEAIQPVNGKNLSNTEISQFAKDFINVKEFGAVGDGITDDQEAIQKAIDAATQGLGGGKLYFPEGIYLVKKIIQLKSNIDIRLDDKATILNGINFKDRPSIVFMTGPFINGGDKIFWEPTENISFSGGTIDMNGVLNEDGSKPKNLPLINSSGGFAIGNSTNVTIRNVTFKDSYQGHAIQIAGSKNVLVDNSRFLGQALPKTMKDGQIITKESIQIEPLTRKGFPYALNDDGKKSENVTIQNSYFGKSDKSGELVTAIGTHYQTLSTQNPSNIKILNNHFDNMMYSGVRFTGFTDILIKGNRFDKKVKGESVHYRENGAALINAFSYKNLKDELDLNKKVVITENTFYISDPKTKSIRVAKDSAEYLGKVSDITVTKNVINNNSKETEQPNIELLRVSDNLVVSENSVFGGKEGIVIEDSKGKITVLNNQFYNLSGKYISFIKSNANGKEPVIRDIDGNFNIVTENGLYKIVTNNLSDKNEKEKNKEEKFKTSSYVHEKQSNSNNVIDSNQKNGEFNSSKDNRQINDKIDNKQDNKTEEVNHKIVEDGRETENHINKSKEIVDVKQKLPKTGSNKIMELFLTVTGIGLLLTLKGLKYYGKDK